MKSHCFKVQAAFCKEMRIKRYIWQQKKMGTQGEQKKQEKFSDLFNRHYAYSMPDSTSINTERRMEDAVVCSANVAQLLGVAAVWDSGQDPL